MLKIAQKSDSGERALAFQCEGAKLSGILHCQSTRPTVGVIILVGGRQYRVGAHRQFVLLARALASSGVAVFRFDVRGMGDSEGEPQNYQLLHDDIAAAIAQFHLNCPSLKHLGLWGLCDGATAALLYTPLSSNINSVMAVNPWIRSEAGKSGALLKHYYRSRVFDKQFIRKLINGKVSVLSSLGSLLKTIMKVTPFNKNKMNQTSSETVGQRVFEAVQKFEGQIHFLISERDLTAMEFHDAYRLFRKKQIESTQLIDNNTSLVVTNADHTFSETNEHDYLCEASVEWALSIRRTG